jgi:hypothetical protein
MRNLCYSCCLHLGVSQQYSAATAAAVFGVCCCFGAPDCAAAALITRSGTICITCVAPNTPVLVDAPNGDGCRRKRHRTVQSVVQRLIRACRAYSNDAQAQKHSVDVVRKARVFHSVLCRSSCDNTHLLGLCTKRRAASKRRGCRRRAERRLRLPEACDEQTCS